MKTTLREMKMGTREKAFQGEIMAILGYLEAEKVRVKKGRHYDMLSPCEKDMILMLDRIHERILREIVLEPTLKTLGHSEEE